MIAPSSAGPVLASLVAALCVVNLHGGPGGPPATELEARAQDAAISSAWTTGSIVVDGSMGDWVTLTRVGDGPAVAAENDADTLMVVVASNDERVREQLATGLVAWIDATGRRQQTFGVRLEGLRPREPGGAGTTAGSGSLDDRIQMTHDAFDLLGPARLQRRLIDDPVGVGMQLSTGVEHGMIVYEMRIPLNASATAPHAVGARPGGRISLGLETPEPPRVRTRRRLDDPMNTNPWIYDPWGYGNYFRPPPPPGGGDRAREPEPVEPMDLVWATIQLAEN